MSRRADAALVLGAAVRAEGAPSPTLRRRALHAADLYHQGKVGRIIASGGPGQQTPTEAEVIRRLCVEAGVPPQAILLEPTATSTRENIANARFVMLSEEVETLCIVTDRYHAPRARLVARQLGIRAVISCPRPVGTRRAMLVKSWLREGPALVYYLLRYGFRR